MRRRRGRVVNASRHYLTRGMSSKGKVPNHFFGGAQKFVPDMNSRSLIVQSQVLASIAKAR